MTSAYFPPSFQKESFHCPYCNVYAFQKWHYTHYYSSQAIVNQRLFTSRCEHCHEVAYWFDEKMLIPLATTAPLPHSDMPESLKEDFVEARNIVNQSPRGAAALLRLALQKLMLELGESGKDINKDIGSLVKKGLPEEIQQALDIVRVIGNESVHPGELDLRDDHDTALQMFELINFIIEERISRKKRISSLFSRLPEGKLKGIEVRDKDKPVEA
ncbi:DUF4145 domain-containing protein [Paenibacillus sp. Marseille-Q9583]